MASGSDAVRRAGVVLRWPVGIGLASWRYMWRTTPVHRSYGPDVSSAGPPLRDAVVDDRLQSSVKGVGPLSTAVIAPASTLPGAARRS